MKKLVVSLVVLTLGFGQALAQKDGGISPEMLSRLEQRNVLSPAQKALKNALAKNGIKSLAMNSENNNYDRNFSHRVSSVGITDQKSSGRCWLFTGQNVLRAKIIDEYNLPGFKFSHVYPFFYDQLEKANLFLQGIIDTADRPESDRMVEWLFKNPLQDGGQYTGVSNILTKYGAVPEEVMPETKSSSSTGEMGRIIRLQLREAGLRLRKAHADGKPRAELMKMKEDYLSDVYRILEMCLGTPPKEFTYTLKDREGKVVSSDTFTPQSFLKTVVKGDLEQDFVMLMNDPSRPYYKMYEIDFDRHVYDGENWTYLNLPMEDIKEMAIASIKGDDMMYFSCDVGKELDGEKGTLDLNNYNYEDIFGITFGMDKGERIRTFASASSHAMTLVGVDLDSAGKPKKWLIENSWGPSSGYQGHLVMTDDWFGEYMFRLVVNKKYLTPKAKSLLGSKPILLPAWDPLF